MKIDFEQQVLDAPENQNNHFAIRNAPSIQNMEVDSKVSYDQLIQDFE